MSIERSESESLALSIATKAHSGQVDKSGNDYILHAMRVSAKGKTENERIVGFLHDVVEDTEVSLADLREAGFSEEIVDAVDCISQRQGERHTDYLARVKGNELAMAVKFNDIEDNTDPSRLGEIDAETKERLIKKYTFAKQYLEG